MGEIVSSAGQSLELQLTALLRCLACGGQLAACHLRPGGYVDLGPDGLLKCDQCAAQYPVIGGTPRMLPEPLQARLRELYPLALCWDEIVEPRENGASSRPLLVQARTGESFAYEWEQFGGLRNEWRKNFLDYLRPHDERFFAGRLVLDVGTGSGRHSREAAQLGARVVAVDVGRSIDVARRNLPHAVLTVQAEAEHLPLERGQFDLVMSIGVLHHLPDTRRAFESIVPYVKPGGWVHVYLYWWPEVSWHRALLKLVRHMRRVTVRLPHRLLHALCYPLAAVLFLAAVLPHRLLRRFPRGERLRRVVPLGTYADYPFGVVVNDQFDRFSAPIERRFTRKEVQDLLVAAGLEEVRVLPNYGWIGSGRRPKS